MNFTNYLDGAGCIHLFAPNGRYEVDFSRTQALIDGVITEEGFSVDESVRRELAAKKRALIEFGIGQTLMFALVCLGLLGTLYLTMHNWLPYGWRFCPLCLVEAPCSQRKFVTAGSSETDNKKT